VLGRKESRKRRVLTEEKLAGIGIRLEASPKKLLRLLALQCGLAKSTAHVDTKSKLRPYKISRPWLFASRLRGMNSVL
jgi:hypothetical protein